jgi:hypothetical protein
MKQIQDILFTTFILEKSKPEFEVRCCGCREIIIPEYKKPAHIIGLINSEEEVVPVIDPSIWYRGEPTRLTTSSCILIVEHGYEHRQLQTGIIISDFTELMEMIAGGYETSARKDAAFNIRFIRELSGNAESNDFLADSHIKLRLCREHKNNEDDFNAFKEIMLRGLVYA